MSEEELRGRSQGSGERGENLEKGRGRSTKRQWEGELIGVRQKDEGAAGPGALGPVSTHAVSAR